ncbi:MAG: F0F1 ATP synthase subunit B [Candidatus Nanopelagicales bacterium]
MFTLARAAETAGEQHSILWPAAYDLLWGGLCFLLLYLLFSKYVLPNMRRALDERTEQIEGGIQRAQELQSQAETTKAAYSDQLAAANKEAAAIRTQARSEGERIIAEAREAAQAAAAATAERAGAQISAERDAAEGSLRRDVGDLAVDLAGKIVGETLNDDTRARAMIDRFIAELEAQAAAGATQS